MEDCKHVRTKKVLTAVIFLSFSITKLFSFDYCHDKTDCGGYASMQREFTEANLLPSYEALSAAINALNGAYKIYQEQLKEQNRLYEQLVKLKQENAKSDSEKLFLMQKLNKLVGNTIIVCRERCPHRCAKQFKYYDDFPSKIVFV